MTKRTKPLKVINRRIIGVTCLHSNMMAPSAYLKYEVTYSDFSTRVESGRSIRTVQGTEHMNGTAAEKKRALRNYRPDLFTLIEVAERINADIQAACVALDEQYGIKEGVVHDRKGT